MRTIKVNYPTHMEQIKIAEKLYFLESISDLDEAINLICEALSPNEKVDPFAEDLCPYFGILWPAACALAEEIGERNEIVHNKKVLELGCGLGLPSLVAAKGGGEVLATDFHPDVEEYFMRNCRHSQLAVNYQRLNWREENSQQQQFDLVIGSDILYEAKHAKEVAIGLLRFVKPGGKIILTDPGRNYLQKFLDAMREEGHQEHLSTRSVKDQEIFVIEYTV